MKGAGRPEGELTESEVREVCAAEVATWSIRGKRILAIVPDNTRTAPMDLMFRLLYGLVGSEVDTFDVLIALGTHPPMSDAAINQRLGITDRDRRDLYPKTKFFNHGWDDPSQLVSIGSITEEEVDRISGGLMRERVDVTINRLVLDYDLLLIVGPTFPHEVVGFRAETNTFFPAFPAKKSSICFTGSGLSSRTPRSTGRSTRPSARWSTRRPRWYLSSASA